MNALETTVCIAMAIILVVVAVYFTWRQQLTLRSLEFNPEGTSDQRRYVLKQTQRRLFGSFLLFVLAGMLIGSLFLDYQMLRQLLKQLPPAEQDAAKQSFRFISVYWMSILLFLMALMALAVFDLWATARHGMKMRKMLLQEHQEMLEAELAQHRHRQAEMN